MLLWSSLFLYQSNQHHLDFMTIEYIFLSSPFCCFSQCPSQGPSFHNWEHTFFVLFLPMMPPLKATNQCCLEFPLSYRGFSETLSVFFLYGIDINQVRSVNDLNKRHSADHPSLLKLFVLNLFSLQISYFPGDSLALHVLQRCHLYRNCRLNTTQIHSVNVLKDQYFLPVPQLLSYSYENGITRPETSGYSSLALLLDWPNKY